MKRLLLLKNENKVLPINVPANQKEWLWFSDDNHISLAEYVEKHFPEACRKDGYNVEINLLDQTKIDPLHEDYRLSNALIANTLWLLSEDWTLRLVDLKNYLKIHEFRSGSFTRLLTTRYIYELMSNPEEFILAVRSPKFQLHLEKDGHLIKLLDKNVKIGDRNVSVVYTELYSVPSNRDYKLNDAEVKLLSTSVDGFVEPLSLRKPIEFNLNK